MRDWLRSEWGIESAKVLYDKPPVSFRRSTAGESRDLMHRLEAEGVLCADDFFDNATGEVRPSFLSTVFHACLLICPSFCPSIRRRLLDIPSASTPQTRKDRPSIIVSSTSWTPDEDFGMLLEALFSFDDAILVSEP